MSIGAKDSLKSVTPQESQLLRMVSEGLDSLTPEQLRFSMRAVHVAAGHA
jgi:hypothetical protein